jgi:hypothetical protein
MRRAAYKNAANIVDAANTANAADASGAQDVDEVAGVPGALRRRGQVWAADFAVSLLIFTAASVLAYTLISNALQNDEYQQVAAEAQVAANIVASEGYPAHWSNGTVIRAGLMSDGHLSLRKARELSSLDQQRLRSALRITDDAYVYVTNSSNDLVPVFSECGAGMAAMTSSPHNLTLPAAAISTGAQTLNITGAPQYSPDEAYRNLSAFDVLVIDGNISSNTTSAQQAALYLEEVSLRGITVIIIGDPGIPVFGVRVNSTSVSNVTIQGDAGQGLGFAPDEQINVSSTVATIETPEGDAVSAYVPIGIANSTKAAYATWVYHDARVWYFASPLGTRPDGTNVTPLLGQSARSMVTVPWPMCAQAAAPPNAKQVAIYRRTMPYHGQLLTLNVLVWRRS